MVSFVSTRNFFHMLTSYLPHDLHCLEQFKLYVLPKRPRERNSVIYDQRHIREHHIKIINAFVLFPAMTIHLRPTHDVAKFRSGWSGCSKMYPIEMLCSCLFSPGIQLVLLLDEASHLPLKIFDLVFFPYVDRISPTGGICHGIGKVFNPALDLASTNQKSNRTGGHYGYHIYQRLSGIDPHGSPKPTPRDHPRSSPQTEVMA